MNEGAEKMDNRGKGQCSHGPANEQGGVNDNIVQKTTADCVKSDGQIEANGAKRTGRMV